MRNEDRFAMISRRLWDDEEFRRWSAPQANAQTLWLYLLSNPIAGSIPGLFRFSVAETAERFAWSHKATEKCFAEIVSSGRALYDAHARLVWLPNALRINPPANPKVVIGWARQWRELPECELKGKAAEAFAEHLAARGKGFVEASAKLFGEPSPIPYREPLPHGYAKSEDKKIRREDSPLSPPSGGAGLTPGVTETRTQPNVDKAQLIQRARAVLKLLKPAPVSGDASEPLAAKGATT
jgi:hypothetical protein